MQNEQIALPKVAIKNCNTVEEAIVDFMQNHSNSYELVVNAIEYGITNDLVKVPVANLHIRNIDRVYQINSHRNKWHNFLSKSMEYFIIQEKYEYCIKVKKLLEFYGR